MGRVQLILLHGAYMHHHRQMNSTDQIRYVTKLTRTMKLLSLLCQFATAKECCEFLKLSALQVYDRKYDGTYRRVD